MLEFFPSKEIKNLQRFNYQKIDSIEPSEISDIKKGLDTFKSEKPLVSVVLICWNEEDFILTTLASLAKNVVDFPCEIIIVNNNSKDDTQKIIDTTGVLNIFEEKQGYAYARQAGLMAAKADIIITGDADSIYPKYWIQEMANTFINSDDQVVCNYSRHAFYSDDDTYPISVIIYQELKKYAILLRNGSRPHLNCGGASMGYRKSVALKFDGYDVNTKRGSDGRLAFELGKLGKTVLVSSKKAVIFTNMRRTQMDGNLLKAFWIRFKYNLKHIGQFFNKQKGH